VTRQVPAGAGIGGGLVPVALASVIALGGASIVAQERGALVARGRALVMEKGCWVRDWMSQSPVAVPPDRPVDSVIRLMRSEGTTSPDAALTEAAGAMLDRKIGALPVLDAGRVVGIVTKSDALEAFLAWAETGPGRSEATPGDRPDSGAARAVM
jgi:CBS domain-containing protein